MTASRRVVAATLMLAVSGTGCTTVRQEPTWCRVTGAAIGAVAGGLATGVAVGSMDVTSDHEGAAIALSTVAGMAVGGLAGLIISKYTCDDRSTPPPAPEPAPEAPPAP